MNLSDLKYTCLIVLFLFMSNNTYAYYNLAGIRDVQIRSENIVTVWLGYEATTDSSALYDVDNYFISSPDDAAFKEKVHPISISRFMKGSRLANGPFDWRVLQDQLMHLKVKNSFKPGKTYVVTLAEGLIPEDHPQTVQFSIDQTPNPSFKLNQVGYSNTAGTKHVYLSSYLGDGKPVDISKYKDFSVVNASTKEEVLKGDIRWISDKDPQGNDALYLLDISSLKEEGYFYVWVNGLGRSYTFNNGNNTAEKILKTAGRGFYFQRCGAALVPPYSGKWTRGMSHNEVYVPEKNIVHPWKKKVDPSDPSAGEWYVPEGPREIHGGHHDAGDFDTRLTHLVVPEKLMSLYEQFPDRFYDGQILIPENNNGIPDILDEAAWNLMHYEYLQDYFGEVRGEFGGVPAGMESYTHPPKAPVMGDGDQLPYFMRKATPYTSFCGAAVFAQAARIFKAFKPEHADKYLSRARAAYAYAVKHKDQKYDPENPDVLPLAWEEEYDDGKLSAAWSWASGQLFATTGEDSFMEDFAKHYKKATTTFQYHRWAAMWPMLINNHHNVNKKIVAELKNELLADADKDLQMVLYNGKKGYRAACPNKGDWGKATPISKIEILNRAYMLTNDHKYRDAIATSIDFMLGMNPSEISWMTHAGTVYPMDPLHINSKFDGHQEPVPGIVIFGPGDSWQNKQNVLYPDPANMGYYRRIADVWGYVPGCEFVVDEQIVNMYVAAGILLNKK